MHRFSDFAEKHRLEGSKMPIREVEGREITVTGYRVFKSKMEGDCMMLQFIMDDETHVLFTGSTVLAEQTEKYRDKIPFITTIRKIGRYYSFT